MGRVDTASLVLALAIQVLASCILILVMGFTIPNPLMLMLWGAIGLLSLTVKFFFWALIAMIVVSWIAPGSRHPALILIYQLTEPVMAPVRKLLPPMGGLDFSPILVFLLINVLEIVIRGLATQAHLPFGLVLGI
jgi:YggT family protein